jgi:hypothetical protein
MPQACALDEGKGIGGWNGRRPVLALTPPADSCRNIAAHFGPGFISRVLCRHEFRHAVLGSLENFRAQGTASPLSGLSESAAAPRKASASIDVALQ